MGHKVSPIGLRVGIIRDWQSRWYADKNYGDLLMEDIKIRDFLFKNLVGAGVSRIEIERTSKQIEIIIRTSRPGVVMGQEHKNIEELSKKVSALVGKDKAVRLNVVEINNPDLDAILVAQTIAEQLEQRASFRSAQKKAIQRTMRAGAKGIKTKVSGRLGGADIARSEGYSEGVVPLHTLRADIDYAHAEARTTYGRLGVKVWICRGEVKRGEMVREPEAPKAPTRDRRFTRRNDRGDANAKAPRAPRSASGANRPVANTPEAIAAIKQEARAKAESTKDGE